MRPSRSWGDKLHGVREDEGSSSLEFITVGLILLVPLVYLVVSLSVLQAGAFAVEGAARQAARVYVQAPTTELAESRAERAVLFALEDYGIDPASARINVDCSVASGACLSRSEFVTVSVHTTVALPLVPDILSLRQATSIPLEGTSTQQVSRFWGSE